MRASGRLDALAEVLRVIKEAAHALDAEIDVRHEGLCGDRGAVGAFVSPADLGEQAASIHDGRRHEQHLLIRGERVEQVVAGGAALVVHRVDAAGREGRGVHEGRAVPRAVVADAAAAIGGVVQAGAAGAGEGDVRREVGVHPPIDVEVCDVLRDELRKADHALGRGAEAEFRELKGEFKPSDRAVGVRAGRHQPGSRTLGVGGDADRAGKTVGVEGHEVGDEQGDLILLAGTQLARGHEEGGGRAVERAGFQWRRRFNHPLAKAVGDFDLEKVVRGRARDGVPRQREVRGGIDGLRGGVVAKVRRGGIRVAGDEQRVRAVAVIHGAEDHGVRAVRVGRIECGLGRERLLELALVALGTVKRHVRTAWQLEEHVGQAVALHIDERLEQEV